MSQGPVGSGMPCAVTGSGVEESPDGALYAFEQLSAVADAVLYEGYLGPTHAYGCGSDTCRCSASRCRQPAGTVATSPSSRCGPTTARCI